MKQTKHKDGSVSHYFESGDAVQLSQNYICNLNTYEPPKIETPKGQKGTIKLIDREDIKRGHAPLISSVRVERLDAEERINNQKSHFITLPVWFLEPAK